MVTEGETNKAKMKTGRWKIRSKNTLLLSFMDSLGLLDSSQLWNTEEITKAVRLRFMNACSETDLQDVSKEYFIFKLKNAVSYF